MFTIDTYLAKSSIHGIGVFAKEYIRNGAIIHKFVQGFDIVYSPEQFSEIPERAKEYIEHYAYYNTVEGGYVLCGDNGRFVNHSNEPNIKMIDPLNTIAIKDINVGDEITEDYYTFDELANIKLKTIMK